MEEGNSEIIYLVSGDPSIADAFRAILTSGRKARDPSKISPDASVALQPQGCKFVVVAHGIDEGTVVMSTSTTTVSKPWLWVGMENKPSGVSVYLYACLAGAKIASYLTDCSCLGHCDEVPQPVGAAMEEVLRYLDQVDAAISHESSDTSVWATRLSDYLNDRLAELMSVDAEGDFMSVLAVLLLRRSVRHVACFD